MHPPSGLRRERLNRGSSCLRRDIQNRSRPNRSPAGIARPSIPSSSPAFSGSSTPIAWARRSTLTSFTGRAAKGLPEDSSHPDGANRVGGCASTGIDAASSEHRHRPSVPRRTVVDLLALALALGLVFAELAGFAFLGYLLARQIY